MAYITFEEFNNTGVEGLFLYPASVWSGFIPMVLFGLFVIVMMSTMFSQRRLSGKGDFKASFAVSGYFVTVIAFLMTLVDGLINSYTLGICVAIAIVGTILLMTSENQ